MDSFAWIEYFSGSRAGERVREHIESSHGATPTIVVAELSEKYRRTGGELGARFDFIRSRTRLVPLDEELARTAGELNFQRKKKVHGWGMADSIVLASGRQRQAKILTGDPHFKDLPETISLRI
ncbi:MAG TPA: type II toxin-antitoxin system VapC family toxin [Candidatus Dormibacteraeota bacterium]|nr:type II toxin-antitoxin system VapC family toxin [Candidatus Dormibacteraeota bacterium]